MKLTAATVLFTSSVSAFSRQAFIRPSSSSAIQMAQEGMDLSGNTWQPDSGKMGSTDVGDYFPDDYNGGDIAFESGMMGSQSGANQKTGPALPGMENLGEDAIMMGGIELSDEIPAGMEFIPSSVPDGTVSFQMAASGSAQEQVLVIKPMCMTFEDYFAAFAPGSSSVLSVSPVTGRMDRRGGEVTELFVRCDPRGKAGLFKGSLVINLPEDNSKLTYVVEVNAF